MDVLLNFATRWLRDDRGEFHGWRLVAAFWAIMLPFALMGMFGLGGSAAWRFGLCMAIIFGSAGIIIAGLDWLRRRRREQREAVRQLGEQWQPRDPHLAASRKRSMGILTMPLVMALVLAGLVRMVSVFCSEMRSDKWPTVIATSTGSEISDRGDGISVAARLRYSTGGTTHERWVSTAEVESPASPQDAQRVAQHYAYGSTHVVWHDPHDPHRVKLAPGMNWRAQGAKVPAVCLLIGIFVGALGAFVEAKRRSASTTSESDLMRMDDEAEQSMRLAS